jgi:Tfp pilus assembly protein PilN
MATVTSPPVGTPAVDNPLRIPPVAVDLLPVEVFQSRRNKRVRRLVVLMVAAFTLVLGAWYGVEYARTDAQQADLTAAEESVRSIRSRQAKFDPLVRIQTETKTIEAQLSTLMASDLQWAMLINSLRLAAPAGVSLTGVTATVNSGSGGTTGGAEQLPSNTTNETIGGLSINGRGQSKELVARYVDALSKVNGVANAFLASAATEDGLVGFSVRLDITSAALNGRYAKKTTGKAGD